MEWMGERENGVDCYLDARQEEQPLLREGIIFQAAFPPPFLTPCYQHLLHPRVFPSRRFAELIKMQ